MFGTEFGGIAGFSESKRETGDSEMPNSGFPRNRVRNQEVGGRQNVGFSEKRRRAREIANFQVVGFSWATREKVGNSATPYWRNTPRIGNVRGGE